MQEEIKKLIEAKKQIILQGAPGTGKTYTAKDIAYQLVFDKPIVETKNRDIALNELETSGQYKLVQFHPSYSYEDFVRGIVVKTENGQPEYTTENKVLAEFAEKAFRNFIDSKKNVKELTQEKWIEQKFEDFKDQILESLEKENYKLTESAYIYELTENAFRYKGDKWVYDFRMNYSDILYLYKQNVKERKEIKKMDEASGLAKQHATYFFKLLTKFRDFLVGQEPFESVEKIDLKNYILIIDEINRANLPAVLGELIYALEYRGQSVESMYDKEGSRKITLPPNLYIIGTMNTADRSVGHIDYAIRRRFAFVGVHPQQWVIETEKGKALFAEVAKLFVKEYNENMENPEKSDYLSPEFEPLDVMIGHSYFMGKEEDLPMRLQYEIKPILHEYLKDGILLEAAKQIITNLNV